MRAIVMYLSILWALLPLGAQTASVVGVTINQKLYTGFQVLSDLSKDEIIEKIQTHYQQYKIRPFVYENTILIENILYPALDNDKRFSVEHVVTPEGNTNAIQMVVWQNKVNLTEQNAPEICEKAKQILISIFENHILKNTKSFTATPTDLSLEQRLANIETYLKNLDTKIEGINSGGTNNMPVTSFEDALKLKMRSEQLSVKEKELTKHEAELEDVDFALQAKSKSLDEQQKNLKYLADSLQKKALYLEKLAKQLKINLKESDKESDNKNEEDPKEEVKIEPKVKNQPKTDSVKTKSLKTTVKKDSTQTSVLDSTKKTNPRGFIVEKKDTTQKTVVEPLSNFKGNAVKYVPTPYMELKPEEVDTLKYLRNTFLFEEALKTPKKTESCYRFEMDMNAQDSGDLILAYMAGLGATQYRKKDNTIYYLLNEGLPSLRIYKPLQLTYFIEPIDDENAKVRVVGIQNQQSITRKTQPQPSFELERLFLHIMGKIE